MSARAVQVGESTVDESTVSADTAAPAVAAAAKTLDDVSPALKPEKLGYVPGHHLEHIPTRQWGDPYGDKARTDSTGEVLDPLCPRHVLEQQHKASIV